MSTPSESRASRIILLVMFGLGIAMVNFPFFLSKPARLLIVLRDDYFGNSLAGKAVTLTDDRDGDMLQLTVIKLDKDDVIWLPRIRSGRLKLRIQIDGYMPADINTTLAPLKTHRVVGSLEPTNGRIKVSIVDASTNKPLPKGYFRIDGGSEVFEPETPIFLPAGEYTLQAEASGFCRLGVPFTIRSKGDHWLKVTLPEELKPGQTARLILSWADDSMLDLDFHLFFVDSSDAIDNPHVFYGKRHGFFFRGGRFAELHADHRHSERFEAMTIFDHGRGLYQVYVHLSDGGLSLTQSGARIEVFTGKCERRAYQLPAPCDGAWWAALDLPVSDGGLNPSIRSQCSSTAPRAWQSTPKARESTNNEMQ